MKIDVSDPEIAIQYRDRKFCLGDLKAVWYRKGSGWLAGARREVSLPAHQKLSDQLNDKLAAESAKLSEYLHYRIEKVAPCLGSPTKCDLNKLIVLDAARQAGFLTPSFIVSNNRVGVHNGLREISDAITKPISDGVYLFDKSSGARGYFSYTERLGNDIGQIDEPAPPSFIQRRIQKSFDLRVFYLAGACYAMAILSQTDEQTKTDLRKYNEAKPNRAIPFAIPQEVEGKLGRLFATLGLNTGSVDLILGQDGCYYFLEINPVGQFGMVSSPCNFHLEQVVALRLMRMATEGKPHERR